MKVAIIGSGNLDAAHQILRQAAQQNAEEAQHSIQQLTAEIRAILARCTVPEKSLRHYYISTADYERLRELSAV